MSSEVKAASLPADTKQLLALADKLNLTYTDVYRVVEILRLRHEEKVNLFVAEHATVSSAAKA